MDQINETGTNNTDKSKNMDKIHESGKKYTFEDLREIMRTLRSEMAVLGTAVRPMRV